MANDDDDDTGAPLDIPRDLDDDDAVDIAITARLAGLCTGCVGVVEEYDAATKQATVSPVVRGRFDQGSTFKYPPIPEVPVRFPAGGGYVLVFPLRVGDFVWLDFADRSLDDWEDSSGDTDVEPASTRRHHISDAVAYAGIRPFGAPLHWHSDPDDADKLIIGQDAYADPQNPAASRKTLKIGPDGIELGSEEIAGSQNGKCEIVSILTDLVLAFQLTAPFQDPTTGVINPALLSILSDLADRLDPLRVV